MVEDEAAILKAPRRRPLPARIATWLGIALAALLALAGIAYVALDTDPGRRFVVTQINQLELASGLDIDIGRIDGSLYGGMVIRELTLRDTRGIFFYAPRADLDWRPFAYLRNRIDVRSLLVPQARLHRMPALNPGDPDAPLLPDLDIAIGRLDVRRLAIDPAVTGRRHVMRLAGRASIADGRAQLFADAGTVAAAGLAGGDRFVLRLDAMPEADRFDLAARLTAPGNGFVAGMTGVAQPVDLRVDGRGRWSDWRGRAVATLAGRPAAALDITGRGGTFTVDGALRPGPLVPAAARRLVEPAVRMNLVATLAERRIDTRLRLSSAAGLVSAEGLVDLAGSRWRDMKVGVRLARPAALAPGITGRDVRLALVLDGAFATPVVTYDLAAAALGFDGTVLEGLRAAGRARVDADRIVVPVSARIARITGLNPAVGGLLTNVRVDGGLAISGSTILSDNLRLRSDRIDATAIVVADLAKGEYRAGLQGRIDNYLIEGVGLVDLQSNLDVVSRGQGFGIVGRVAFRTRRIDNGSARDFLGGQAVGRVDLALGDDGIVRLSNLRVTAPQLRITSGGGTYALDGRLNLVAAGTSAAYGPLSVRVTGTVAAPDVRIRAARPGFGIGLADVDLQVRAVAGGYAITGRGQSQYGPFTADLLVRTGRGPITIDVRRLVFAGFTFTGQVRQSPAGPFVGTLQVAGSGLDGVVRLSAVGAVQRADVDARADGASIPGDPPILIRRGLVRATAILYPGAPSVTADVQLAGVRRDQLLIDTARARVAYRGGRGRVDLAAAGRSGVPFNIGLAAAVTPDLVRATVQGSVNRVNFRLAEPARITRAGGGWQLAPATIVLPQGNVRLAGRYAGGNLSVQSRFANLDLSIANAFYPGLGLGGKATGSLDFAQAAGTALPRADARVRITGFTRAGVATLSAPVDVAFVGALGDAGASASAVIRRQAAVIGRLQARIVPAGAGAWTDRLAQGALSGGIRYNGPAQVLWSLTGIADQQLSGPVGIAADFSGRADAPQVTGVVRANDLTFVDETYGTRITRIALAGRFDRAAFVLDRLTGRAGDGTVSATGRVGLAAAAGFPIDIQATLDRARLARSDNLGATVSGTIAITNGPDRPALISGDLRLPEVRYQIVRQGAAEVIELAGVRRKGDPLPEPGAQAAAGVPSIWNLDLRVRANNQLFVSGLGLESEWSADLRVRGTTATPQIVGDAEVLRGTYSFSGNRFELTSGSVAFDGSRPINPRVSIAASGEVQNVTITIAVSGSATNPQIAFSSSPGLPQDEIMARLLFGGSVSELSALQLVQVGSSLNALRGGSGGLNPLGKLRSATGLNRLRILGADDTTGRGTALAAGFYLSDKIYLEIVTDARGFTATQIEIALSKALSLLSQAGSQGTSNLNLRYRKQY